MADPKKPAPILSVYLDPRLLSIVRKDAKSRGIPVSEAGAQAIAKAYGRPDLGEVPRKVRGRKAGQKVKGNAKRKRPL